MVQPDHAAWGRRVSGMAVIAATGVAVIYIPQPIQTLVALEFGIEAAAAAAATVAVQAGYALGVVLLVSLGDRISARAQVTTQLVATALALGAAAASPAYAVFVALSFVAGATATVGQLLISAALRLAPPAARARTAAVLLGSFMVGLFAVRTALGTVAELIGWRGAVVACALFVLALVPLSLRVSPSDSPAAPPPYGRILLSIPRIAASSPVLRLMTAVHVLCFMAFISLWSMTTVYAVTELGLTVTQASLVGLAGLLGGVATIAAAPLHARFGVRRSLTVCIAAALVGAVLIAVVPGAGADARRPVPRLGGREQRAGLDAGRRARLRRPAREWQSEHRLHGCDIPGRLARDGDRLAALPARRLCSRRHHGIRAHRERSIPRRRREAARDVLTAKRRGVLAG